MRAPYRSFAAGEISEAMAARQDFVKYQTGLKTCRNFITRHEGSAENRSGFGLVCPVNFFKLDTRLIPFVFNDKQAYVLAISSNSMFVIKDGAPIFEGEFDVNSITQSATPQINQDRYNNGAYETYLAYLTGVNGMVEVNDRWVTIENIFEFDAELREDGFINTSGFGAYTSGGSLNYVKHYAYGFGSQLEKITYKQTGDTLVLAGPGLQPTKIIRISDTDWQISAITFQPEINAPENGATSGTGGSVTTRYKVVAEASLDGEKSYSGYQAGISCTVNDDGPGLPYRIVTGANHKWATGQTVIFRNGYLPPVANIVGETEYVITVTSATAFTLDGTVGTSIASHVGQTVFGASIARDDLAAPSSSNLITITWNAVTGAYNYKVYRETNGVFGFIGNAVGPKFIDQGFSVDYFDTPPIRETFINSSNDWPYALGLYQQRAMYGGSNNDPEGTRASRIGSIFNLSKSLPIQDDDSFRWICSSERVNRVRHYLDMGKLLIFTEGNVFSVEGNDSGSLTPKSPNVRLRASQGIGQIEPLTIGDVALFVTASGRRVRELIPQGDKYDSNDITVFARHLFKGRSVVRWAWAEEPYNIAWLVMDDGQLLSCTYLRKHEILAWHRHDTGSDKFLDVVAVPENNEHVVYAVVERYNTNGETHRYIERLSSREDISDADDGRFFDSFAVYDGTNTTEDSFEVNFDDTFSTFPYETFTLTRSGYFTAEEVGNIYVFTNDDGTQYECEINEVYSSDLASVNVIGEDNVPYPYGFSSANWQRRVDVLSGLWHLEGREVYGVGDREAIGPFTVLGGKITLPKPMGRVTIGVKITAQITTLEPENPQGETWAANEKSVGNILVRVFNTSGIKIGQENEILDEIKIRDCVDSEESELLSGELYTGRIKMDVTSTQSPTGGITIEQSLGLPTTILGIYPDLEIGEE